MAKILPRYFRWFRLGYFFEYLGTSAKKNVGSNHGWVEEKSFAFDPLDPITQRCRIIYLNPIIHNFNVPFKQHVFLLMVWCRTLTFFSCFYTCFATKHIKDLMFFSSKLPEVDAFKWYWGQQVARHYWGCWFFMYLLVPRAETYGSPAYMGLSPLHFHIGDGKNQPNRGVHRARL